MNANLLALVQDSLGGDFSKLAGPFLGESQDATGRALGALVPAVLGTVAQQGSTPDGASKLLSLIESTKLDASSLGDVAGLFGSGGTGAQALMKTGTDKLLPALLGDKAAGVADAVSATSGIQRASATSLLAMVVPLVLGYLKKLVGDKRLDAGALSSLLASQLPGLKGALDSRMSTALGLAAMAGPGSALGGLAGRTTGTVVRDVEAMARSAGASAAAARPALMRWLPWLVGAAVILFLWTMLSGRFSPAPTSNPDATPMMSAPPGAVAAGPLAKVYFGVGESAVSPAGSATIAEVAQTIRGGEWKVAITGYTDRSGDAAMNEELAKSRAIAVGEALKAAGVPAQNIEMKPPVSVEIGAATGADAEARRVEISRQ